MILRGFTYAMRRSSQFGLIVNDVKIYGSPARNIEKVSVPYRNGDLLLDYGTFTNYITSFEVSLYKNTEAMIPQIAEWLLSIGSYTRLEDDWHPGEFRQAIFTGDIEWIMSSLSRYGKAEISFDCKPQRFLISGESAISYASSGATVTLNNPTNFYSRPLIVLEGNGSVTINGYTITVTNNTNLQVTIDCESMQCYRGNTNMNNYVALDDFPQLKPGNNTITGDLVNHMSITPRWWHL